MKRKIIIAVDGNSSSGKSTFAKEIARELNYLYIDTGAMYRAVTLYCMRKGYVDESVTDKKQIEKHIRDIDISFRYNPDSKQYETYMNGENVESEIRQIEVSSYVSTVSKIAAVRERMVELQREIGMMKGIVMDGRDIGTVVFPEAELKIFMTASEEARAQRRFKELKEEGNKIEYNEVLKNITERDRIDSERELSPLKKASDAFLLDNSDMTVKEQMDWFTKIFKNKLEE